MAGSYCPECGTLLDGNYKFCPNCGFSLASADGTGAGFEPLAGAGAAAVAWDVSGADAPEKAEPAAAPEPLDYQPSGYGAGQAQQPNYTQQYNYQPADPAAPQTASDPGSYGAGYAAGAAGAAAAAGAAGAAGTAYRASDPTSTAYRPSDASGTAYRPGGTAGTTYGQAGQAGNAYGQAGQAGNAYGQAGQAGTTYGAGGPYDQPAGGPQDGPQDYRTVTYYDRKGQKGSHGCRTLIIIAVVLFVVIFAVLAVAGMLMYEEYEGGGLSFGGGDSFSFPGFEDDEDSNTGTITNDQSVVKITDSGYYLDESGYAHCGAVFRNTSDKDAWLFPTISVTAYDDSGDVLASSERFLSLILPGEEQAASLMMDCNGEKPDRIEFTMDPGEISDQHTHIPPDQFELRNMKLRDTGSEFSDELTITGKLKNNSNKDCDFGTVVFLLKKDGKIVFADSDSFSKLRAGKTKALDHTIWAEKLPAYDTCDVIIMDDTI